MYVYENSFYVSGSVKRPPSSKLDKGIVRPRALDSLLASRLHTLNNLPELLLYSSTDGSRPGMSNLFSRIAPLNNLSDFWNSMIKEPRTSALIAQIVDENPGQSETTRAALEMSLFKVKPFDLSYFEMLLEVQEQVYGESDFGGVFVDPLQRLIALDSKSKRSYYGEAQDKKILLLEAYIEPESTFEEKPKFSNKLFLRGRDSQVEDFRTSLRGIRNLFLNWDQWLGELGLHSGSFDCVYLYSHVKGLLPACWEELRSRGVATEQVRLPQWAGYANAVSSYLEFLLGEGKRAAFIHLPINGRCHLATWERLG